MLYSLINDIVPKSGSIIFSSFPDYSDNAFSFAKYILDNRPDIANKYKLIWAYSNVNTIIPLELQDSRVRFVKKKSLKGVWACLRAKYVLHTHGFFSNRIKRSSKKQTIVNLWHGCGYKTIMQGERSSYYGDMNIVTGEAYRLIHSKLFSIPYDCVLPIGLPRNDELFDTENVKEILRLEKFDRIYLWMPTYRKAAFGHNGIDGSKNAFGINSLSINEYTQINEALIATNSVLVIKPHPMDSIASRIHGECSNVRFITNDVLCETNVALYRLIGCSDVLMSDYSSVVIDYLLLDRPIIMTISDIEEYKASRGFVFESIEEYMPGPIVSTTESLLSYFCDPKSLEEEWSKRRNELTRYFHTCSDGNSCKRLCDYLFGEDLITRHYVK